MNRHFTTSKRSDMRPLAFHGFLATDCYAQLQRFLDRNKKFLERQGTPEAAFFLAEPVFDEKLGKIDWYTKVQGTPCPVASLPADEQAAAYAKAGRCIRALKALSESSARLYNRMEASLLALAIQHPSEQDIFVFESTPVLINWGFETSLQSTAENVKSIQNNKYFYRTEPSLTPSDAPDSAEIDAADTLPSADDNVSALESAADNHEDDAMPKHDEQASWTADDAPASYAASQEDVPEPKLSADEYEGDTVPQDESPISKTAAPAAPSEPWSASAAPESHAASQEGGSEPDQHEDGDVTQHDEQASWTAVDSLSDATASADAPESWSAASDHASYAVSQEDGSEPKSTADEHEDGIVPQHDEHASWSAAAEHASYAVPSDDEPVSKSMADAPKAKAASPKDKSVTETAAAEHSSYAVPPDDEPVSKSAADAPKDKTNYLASIRQACPSWLLPLALALLLLWLILAFFDILPSPFPNSCSHRDDISESEPDTTKELQQNRPANTGRNDTIEPYQHPRVQEYAPSANGNAAPAESYQLPGVQGYAPSANSNAAPAENYQPPRVQKYAPSANGNSAPVENYQPPHVQGYAPSVGGNVAPAENYPLPGVQEQAPSADGKDDPAKNYPKPDFRGVVPFDDAAVEGSQPEGNQTHKGKVRPLSPSEMPNFGAPIVPPLEHNSSHWSRTPKGGSMQLPQDASKTKDISFLEGCWQAEANKYETPTGDNIVTEYCFRRNGTGQRTIKTRNGEICSGAARAKFSGSSIKITADNARCSSGSYFAPQKMQCTGKGSSTRCYAKERDKRGNTAQWATTLVRK